MLSTTPRPTHGSTRTSSPSVLLRRRYATLVGISRSCLIGNRKSTNLGERGRIRHMNKAEGVKLQRVNTVMNESGYRFVSFKGSTLMSGPGTNGFIPFDRTIFGRLVQSTVEGLLSENMINDFAGTVKTLASDWSHNDKYISFGRRVWDMEKLDWIEDQLEWVYSSSIEPNDHTEAPTRFLNELACGDEGLARDYLRAIAPLVMYKKPSGIIWFVGDGANGKSSLINAVYKIIGRRYLASLTTAGLEDGKAALALRGVLGNVVLEASEGRVDDTSAYKAVGTHESFSVRQLYTQELVTIDTNFHNIFNANNVPVFSDKTLGARRRTLVIPFKAHFKDDPTFDDRTFTDDFLGGFLTLVLDAAREIRDNHYRYNWSDTTVRAKEAYDSEVNSAEAFINSLVQSGVVGFSNYGVLKINYENWCSNRGFTAIGITTLKRTVTQMVNPDRRSLRVNGKTSHRYVFSDAPSGDFVWLDNGYGVVSEGDPLPAPKPVNERMSNDW